MGTADTVVLDALRRLLPLGDLPRVLWWVGPVRPQALTVIEQRGQVLADALGAGRDVDHALASWLEALEVAVGQAAASGHDLGPRPVWSFWSLFTRPGDPESELSRLLRERIGYPSDQEAGFGATTRVAPPTTPGPCVTCGGIRWWRLSWSAIAMCAGCFDPPDAPDDLEYLWDADDIPSDGGAA